MKKQILIFLMVIALLLAACDRLTPAATPLASATPPATGQSSSNQVIAEGRITPRDYANLYAAVPGQVVDVSAQEGDFVTQGTVLLRVGQNESILSTLAAAQAEVLAAQQALDQLERTADLAYNQAVLDETAAKDALQAAQKAHDDFDQEQYDTDLDEAKADVATANKELQEARDDYAQYADLDKNNTTRKQAKDVLDTAETKYNDALIALTAVENRLLILETNLALAQGRLDEAVRVRQQREAGPDQEQWSLAQARLVAGEAAVTAAQAALAQLEVKAPYDGVIVRVDIAEGERALPNQPLMVIADLSEWLVETTDLTENEVVDISEGQAVRVILDALPGQELPGTVERIGLTYTEKSGDVVYAVRITLDENDERLRWGMTVEVWFTP